jgi:hypothetical protein
MPPRGWNRHCSRPDAWEHMYGTTASGNLPDWKKDDHEGHCWSQCPYSTQSSDLRTRHLLGLSDTDPLPVKVDHTESGRTYFMKTEGKGSAWGYECTYDNCPYYLANGRRYFYV